jgi:hypothetical protein
MKEDGGMINAGRELLERLEPLAAHLRLEIGETRDIAAGPRQACYKAAANGIGNIHENDRRMARQWP